MFPFSKLFPTFSCEQSDDGHQNLTALSRLTFLLSFCLFDGAKVRRFLTPNKQNRKLFALTATFLTYVKMPSKYYKHAILY